MAKKQKLKKKEIKDDKKVKGPQRAPTLPSDPTDESFNFGGLPERNLKKNLGCG
jgi:hypothetical protein